MHKLGRACEDFEQCPWKSCRWVAVAASDRELAVSGVAEILGSQTTQGSKIDRQNDCDTAACGLEIETLRMSALLLVEHVLFGLTELSL